MDLKTIEWKNNRIKIIDQIRLPHRLEYIYIDNIKDLRKAIRTLSVRGAPALGAAAGLGVYLGIKGFKGKERSAFNRRVKDVAYYLASARPTARNLSWGIERVCNVALMNRHLNIDALKLLMLKESLNVINNDIEASRSIGRYGASLIKDKDVILTICNAGILATVDYGTALGVLYRAKEEGKSFRVYVSETRPLLQGARLTAWELKKKGIEATVICDNTAASLFKDNKINKVISGADRIALNGDTANKIGTYNLAILSKYHNIPFYIAAPLSTFDFSLKGGDGILIEERNPQEVTTLLFKRNVAPFGVKVFNPSFDITRHELISAIITDKGIIRPPYDKNIGKHYVNQGTG